MTRKSSFSWGAAFLLVPGALATALLLRWPVVALDTDLWYHLRAGAYILDHHALPRESFFSFLEPSRPWLDYYWLFQAAAALVHGAAGYAGLILLRASTFAAAFGFLAAMARREEKEFQPYATFLLGLACILLFHRFALVRPHLLVYLFLAAALYILEKRPAWLPALPAVGLLWGNVHGVSYPVWLALLAAYAAEALLAGRSRDGDRRLAWLAASAASVLITPLGIGLLGLPFLPRAYASAEIAELVPVSLRELVMFPFKGAAPTTAAASNFLIWLSLAAAGLALLRRKARPAHLILLAAGLALLGQGRRFRYEAFFLAWPLLCAVEPPAPRRGLPRWGEELLLLAALFFPAVSFKRVVGATPRWPLSTRNLPAGVTAYLTANAAEGRLLNHPSKGGFYEWELYPRLKIAMDLQVPFLFKDDDLRELAEAYRAPEAMGRLLERYEPDFVAAPLSLTGAGKVLRAFPRYVPVFLDDVEALWVDSRRHPDLAKRDALPVDPFAPLPEPGAEAAGKGCALPPYLARLIAVDPRALRTRALAARWCIAGGDPEGGLAHAQALIDNYPDQLDGYLLRTRLRLDLKYSRRP